MNLLSNLNVDQFLRLVDDYEFLMWGIEGEFNYINTRFFAFRIESSEMEENEDAWELDEYLKKTFKNSPESGHTLVMQYGRVTEGKHHVKQIDEKFIEIPANEGTVTPLIYAADHFRYRWVKFNDFDLFIQDEFASLLYVSANESGFAKDSDSPLYLCNGDLMILPVRDNGGKISNLARSVPRFDRITQR